MKNYKSCFTLLKDFSTLNLYSLNFLYFIFINNKYCFSNGLLSESTLWNYAIQLSGALRVIHGSGLALRGLCQNRVLVTGNINSRARLRINCVVIMDILLNDVTNSNMINHFQVSENS